MSAAPKWLVRAKERIAGSRIAVGSDLHLLEMAVHDYEAMRDAANALLSNEEHAVSGGMRSYQKGSPTWQCWEDLRNLASATA